MHKKLLQANTAVFADNIASIDAHLLIGGASGAGKSTAVDLIIRSLLLRDNTPLFVFIDPKRIDLFKYKDMKNTLVYTDTDTGAIEALNNAVDLMENRYIKMQKAGVTKCTARPVYIVIDELADLVLTDKNAFKPLQRILQKGRASNIFCILATQIVCVAVLPTLLRGNITRVLALHCETANISRLLINHNGAEVLPLHGRGLLKTPAGFSPVSIPYFNESEIIRVVKHFE